MSRRLARRLDDVHARLTGGPAARVTGTADPEPDAAVTGQPPLPFRSRLSRAAFEAGVEAVREHIARGDIYQANLTRRLETPFDADPWERYRRLRTGDPVALLGVRGPRFEPADGPAAGAAVGLARSRSSPLDAAGHVTSDPIKGTRRAAGRATRTGHSHATCSRAPRTGPRT